MSLMFKNGTHWIDCSHSPVTEHKLTELENHMLTRLAYLEERVARLEENAEAGQQGCTDE